MRHIPIIMLGLMFTGPIAVAGENKVNANPSTIHRNPAITQTQIGHPDEGGNGTYKTDRRFNIPDTSRAPDLRMN